LFLGRELCSSKTVFESGGLDNGWVMLVTGCCREFKEGGAGGPNKGDGLREDAHAAEKRTAVALQMQETVQKRFIKQPSFDNFRQTEKGFWWLMANGTLSPYGEGVTVLSKQKQEETINRGLVLVAQPTQKRAIMA